MPKAHISRTGFDDNSIPKDTLRAVSIEEPLPVDLKPGEINGIMELLNDILEEMKKINEQLSNITEVDL